MVKQRAEKTFATREQAREAGYVPTEDLEVLLERDARWLKKIFKDAGIVPVRVGHAYWWNEQEILTWAQTYKWQRPKGAPPLPCSIEGCARDAWANNMPGFMDALKKTLKESSSAMNVETATILYPHTSIVRTE